MASRSAATGVERRDSRSGGGGRLFPAGTGRWARRRLMELGALALLAFAAVILAVCVTYDPGDPSLNRATSGPVHNALGLPGAYVADVFMQTLGVVAYLLPLLLLGWVWRLLRHQGIRQFWLRLAALPAALFLLALAVQAVPAPESWPIGSGLGGIAGFLFLEELARLTGLGAGLVALLAAVLGIPAALYASAIRLSEWRAVGRGTGRLVTGLGAGRRPADETPAEPDLRRGALADAPREEPELDSATEGDEPPGRGIVSVRERSAGDAFRRRNVPAFGVSSRSMIWTKLWLPWASPSAQPVFDFPSAGRRLNVPAKASRYETSDVGERTTLTGSPFTSSENTRSPGIILIVTFTVSTAFVAVPNDHSEGSATMPSIVSSRTCSVSAVAMSLKGMSGKSSL